MDSYEIINYIADSVKKTPAKKNPCRVYERRIQKLPDRAQYGGRL